jgi:glycosyltransferase involved in cell wall biosynthesis
VTHRQDSHGVPSGLPLLSIVIPVWNVAAYLDACLDSITSQSFRDVEIIAVEGASTDTSDAVLDRRAAEMHAAGDARLTAIHLDPPPGEHRVGPGRARNAGLACAKGEYIWFVDGDDAIEAGSLAAIASRISRDGPDVLLVGNVRVSADGKRMRAGHDQQRLLPGGGPYFTLAERPGVAQLSMASWNKIIRREFLLSTHASYVEKKWPHEDIPVSCAVLVAAQSIGILSAPCYRYREDRRDSAMMTSNSARHSYVFDAWKGVLSAARKRLDANDPAVAPEIYAILFERSIWHLTNIYDKRSIGIRRPIARRYIGRRFRRKFFAQMREHYEAFKPDDFQRPPSFRGIKFTLIEKDAYFRYGLLAPLNGLRNWIRRARRSGLPAARRA